MKICLVLFLAGCTHSGITVVSPHVESSHTLLCLTTADGNKTCSLDENITAYSVRTSP